MRTGDHCSSVDREDTVRVSLQIYNTKQEIDRFVEMLEEIIG